MGTLQDFGSTVLPVGLLASILPAAVVALVGADFPVGPLSPLRIAGNSMPCPEMTRTVSAGIAKLTAGC